MEGEIEAFEDVDAEMEADAAEEGAADETIEAVDAPDVDVAEEVETDDVDLSDEADAAFEASLEEAAEDTSETEASDKEGEK